MIAMTAVVALAVLAAVPAAQAQVRVQCESRDYRYQFCPLAAPIDGVWLVQQRSRTACIEGQTWGWDRRGVWVDRGCDGIFEVQAGRPPPAVQQAPARDPGYVIGCESRDYQYEFCSVPETIAFARILAQRSGAACIEGRTWGWRPNGIWVSGGCEGDFQYRTVAPTMPPQAVVYCGSRDHRYTFCPTGPLATVQILAQQSQSACIHGSTWGYRNDGIWVDRGCAAEFEVQPR